MTASTSEPVCRKMTEGGAGAAFPLCAAGDARFRRVPDSLPVAGGRRRSVWVGLWGEPDFISLRTFNACKDFMGVCFERRDS